MSKKSSCPKYTEKFKKAIVSLYQNVKTYSQIQKEYGGVLPGPDQLGAKILPGTGRWRYRLFGPADSLPPLLVAPLLDGLCFCVPAVRRQVSLYLSFFCRIISITCFLNSGVYRLFRTLFGIINQPTCKTLCHIV